MVTTSDNISAVSEPEILALDTVDLITEEDGDADSLWARIRAVFGDDEGITIPGDDYPMSVRHTESTPRARYLDLNVVGTSTALVRRGSQMGRVRVTVVALVCISQNWGERRNPDPEITDWSVRRIITDDGEVLDSLDADRVKGELHDECGPFAPTGDMFDELGVDFADEEDEGSHPTLSAAQRSPICLARSW